MTLETYVRAWSQLSESARHELVTLASDLSNTPMTDALRRELLAHVPDAVVWRSWQPTASSPRHGGIDGRLLDWVRDQPGHLA